MKNNYDKYIKEVWDIKEQIYKEFKESKKDNFLSFINEKLKNINVDKYLRKKTIIEK